jgi:hypothetical protein
MTFIRYFIYIAVGALVSSLIGGLFACIVSIISPECVKGLFSPSAGTAITRYAAAVGMIWGIFLGTAAMGLSLFLATTIQVAKLMKKKADQKQEDV